LFAAQRPRSANELSPKYGFSVGITKKSTADDKMSEEHLEPIPQPPTDLILGNLRLVDKKAPTQSLAKLALEYYPILRFQFLGGRTVLFISSQELADDVCNEDKFKKLIGKALENVRAFAGDGLFTAHNTEPNWITAHRILMPACNILYFHINIS
jgi:cytochrome P450